MGALSVGTGLSEGPSFADVASVPEKPGESVLTVPGTVGLPNVDVAWEAVCARAGPTSAVESIVASSNLMAILLIPQSGIGCSTC